MTPLENLLSNAKISWPDETTRIFREGDDTCASVAWLPQQHPWRAYALGYKLTGECLFERWKQIRLDALVFPMVFAHRHYVEVCLKELILTASALLEKQTEWKCRHDIRVAWGRVKKLLAKIKPSASARDIANIERLLLELDEVDPEGMVFRYPIKLDEQPHLPPINRFDVENFHGAMCQISIFLDSASDMIGEYLSETRSAH